MTERAPSRLRLLLLAMYLDAEETAVCGHETFTSPGSVFDDAVWREGDGTTYFKLLKRVRTALGLKPFRHRDRKGYGHADKRWALHPV